MDGFGMMDHEKVGAAYLLKLGFSDRLCKLIASHVNAKRYLTWKDSGYYDQLSTASKKTLEYQGGRMQKTEAMQFESDPLFDLYIKMRRWDAIMNFRKMAIEHLQKKPHRKKSIILVVGCVFPIALNHLCWAVCLPF